MKLKNKLVLNEVALTIISDWDDAQNYKKSRSEKETASLIVNLYNYISSSSKKDVDYILSYLHEKANPRLYLVFHELVCEYRTEKTKINFLNNIFSKITKVVDNIGNKYAKKVCVNNQILIRGNSNVNIQP